nr:Coenzyme F420 hydrogenase/dehydrogenase, beta subunit C-terminal domain [Propioniciclava soli]
MGTHVAAWRAWATAPDVRHRGSSGGTLTALSAWLLESGRARSVASAAADPEDPRRTRSLPVVDRAGALACAGSRYAPACSAALPVGAGEAFVGKPCEASATRALHAGQGASAPLILSFFCAGTPSQHATDDLAAELAAGQPIADLWYRGRGWPGQFTVEREGGTTASITYDESWGKRLGPTTQWRCKICVDGIGDSADVVAADLWETDVRGYPTFAAADGCSALIARTERGRQTVLEAVRAGVLAVEEIDMDRLAAVQPLQVQRRTTLFGRLLGVRLAGRRVPDYRGFGLARWALKSPRAAVRALRGSWRRTRRARTALSVEADGPRS